MFSMKIGLAAFDQPGQLNRPFNYPIRYIYILPSLESPRLEERTIGPNWLALHAMFHLLFNFVRTMERVRSHGDAFRIDPVLLADEHPWHNTPFVTNHSVLHDIHRVNLIRFPVVRWKVIDPSRSLQRLYSFDDDLPCTIHDDGSILFYLFLFGTCRQFFFAKRNSKLLCVVTWTADRSMIQPWCRRWQWSSRFAANSSAPATTYAISRSPSGRLRSPPPRSG